ncbi:MAG: recombinase family protein [Jatrophihabitantaceae bacterium]
MGSVDAAAVYARISSDVEGRGLGVARQVEDCRRLAAERGWRVAEEYVDNDVSAYSGKPRPAYARMVEDLQAGVRDAVIVYNLDRLHRRPSELEDFVALCERVGVRDVATVTADIDLGNDDGLFMARIFAAFAAKESGRRSARVRRKNEQSAQAGVPHGGGDRRPFGYAPDRVTVIESEAAVLRELAERFVAGESLRSLTMWLKDEGVSTVGGGQWRSQAVRQMLMAPRIAGLRAYHGEVVGEASWPAIITAQQRQRVLSALQARKASGRRAPRKYLLTGLLRCGRCGHVLYSQARYDSATRTGRYLCLRGPDHGGCGRLSVVSAPVEELITQAVLTRLDSPELAAALSGQASADAVLRQLGEQLAADRGRLDELAALYAAGDVSAREWMIARNPIQDRVADTERQLSTATETTALDGLIGNAEQLRGQWADLSIDRRQAIIRAVLDHAVIAPSKQTPRFDLNRVQPLWRY